MGWRGTLFVLPLFTLLRGRLQLTAAREQIPFFLDGNSDVLVSPTRGPGFGKYPAVTVEQHLRTKFDASYHEKSGEEIMQAVVRGGVATA